MTIVFPCVVYRHEALGEIVQPYASVILRHGGHTFAGEFLIDSGADITLIPRGVGELLGLSASTDDIDDLGDLQATLPAIYREVDLQIGDDRGRIRLAWALTEHVPLILGRLDVFDLFDIEFRQSERCTIFRRSSSNRLFATV